MKALRRIFNTALTLFVLNGCASFAFEEELSGNFYVVAVDVEKQMAIYYRPSEDDHWRVIDATVFAVGFDDEFIIVKQHPGLFTTKPDKSITNYFIIPLVDMQNQSPDEITLGPMDEKEFNKMRQQLGVPSSVKFTKVFKDLE